MAPSNLDRLAQGDFAQSRWLTEAAKALLQRDPLDALADAEALVRALRADFDALVERIPT